MTIPLQQMVCLKILIVRGCLPVSEETVLQARVCIRMGSFFFSQCFSVHSTANKYNGRCYCGFVSLFQ